MALMQINYTSQALARIVTMNVILPCDKYDFDTDKYLNKPDQKYKTLYLLHGLIGNYTDWVNETRILKWAMEKNLAVVMPSGDNSFYIKGKMPFGDYDRFIGEELINITRRMFPLSDKYEDTYICGLSMGGYGAIRTGLVYSKNFSYVAGLSSALCLFNENVPKEDADVPQWVNDSVWADNGKDISKTNLNVKIAYEEMIKNGSPNPKFYLSCGRKDDLFEFNEDFRDFLISKGADVTWDEDPEAAHTWDFWDAQIKKVLEWLPL